MTEIGNHVLLYQDNALTSPVHFCLNGRGNQQELMSYVLVLKKKKLKIKVVETLPLKESQLSFLPSFPLFFFHPSLLHVDLCQPRGRRTEGERREIR